MILTGQKDRVYASSPRGNTGIIHSNRKYRIVGGKPRFRDIMQFARLQETLTGESAKTQIL